MCGMKPSDKPNKAKKQKHTKNISKKGGGGGGMLNALNISKKYKLTGVQWKSEYPLYWNSASIIFSWYQPIGYTLRDNFRNDNLRYQRVWYCATWEITYTKSTVILSIYIMHFKKTDWHWSQIIYISRSQ